MRGAVDGRFGDADDDNDDEDDAARRLLTPPPSVKGFRAFSFHLLNPRLSNFPLHDFSFGDGWSIFRYRGNSPLLCGCDAKKPWRRQSRGEIGAKLSSRKCGLGKDARR